jgi:Zn-dependent protease
MDFEHLRWGLLELILLIISVGLHEFGHAWVADLRGDPLPRLQGRVTLNPFAHADPIGTIAIPALMIFLSPGFGMLGWGKPVQVSLPNPKTRRVDDILITLAGPAMNLVLCLVIVVIGAALGVVPSLSKSSPAGYFLLSGLFLNTGLFLFNLVPVPPLDGSRLAVRFGLYSEEVFLNLARWGFISLLVLLNIPIFQQGMHWVLIQLITPWLYLWNFLLYLRS